MEGVGVLNDERRELTESSNEHVQNVEQVQEESAEKIDDESTDCSNIKTELKKKRNRYILIGVAGVILVSLIVCFIV